MNARAAVTLLASACFAALAIAAARLPFRAASPNPRSSALWIDRGLSAERAHDFAAAERDLLTAARFDRQYLPAWTLANFYFRRAASDVSARDSFWLWAHRAAALSYDDLAPLLQLADALAPGRALDRLGDSARLKGAYLDLLIGQARFDDAVMLARGIDDRPRLRSLATRLIAAGRAADAVDIWKRAGTPPAAFTGEGFDWLLPSPGVTSAWHSPVLDFALDGAQPETVALLERVVSGGRAVHLTFEYITDIDGLRWAIGAHESAALVPSPPESAQDWRRFECTLPARAPLERLVFFYRRDPGHTRATGSVKLRNLPSGLSY